MPLRSLAILLVIKYTQIHQLSLPEILDTDILKPHIPDQIIITCIDSQAALDNPPAFPDDPKYQCSGKSDSPSLHFFHISMQPDKNRMRHIGP